LGRDGEDKELIWVSGEAEYFLNEDWTGQIRLKWFDKFGCTRKARQRIRRR
jgi:hypothetical protein